MHRDLAPKNILVGVDGRARIMDFGIAHAVERLTRTTTGQIKGTVRYFSPEQADLQPLDQRSDIFSMGIVAYEMLTGTRLFAGRNMIEIYQQVMSQRIPDVREVVRDIPQGVAQVVAKALERDPAKRFQRALEFANALSEQIADPPDDQDLRSFVRTNLPAHARELQRLLREDSSAFRTEVLATHEDDAPPTVVTGGPSMTQLPPRPAAEPEASGVVGAVGADVSTTSASAVESRGWWSRFVSWLVGRQEAERHEGYSKQLGSLLARRQDSVSTRRALEPPGYVLVFPRHEASRDGDARLRALRAALARLVL